MTSRVFYLAALVASLSMLTPTLSGCTSAETGGETAESARDRLYADLDETQRLLGGVWDIQDDPTSRGCTIAAFSEGELYPALRVGPPPGDVAAAVASVTALWRTLGYTVDEGVIDTVREVQGERGDSEIAIFRASAEAMTLHGESECRTAAAG
jgi:hypothetical protein